MDANGEPVYDWEALTGQYARVRRRWPRVEVALCAYGRFLADRGAASPALPGWVHADDLYLTCACLHGVPPAIRVLEREYLLPLMRSTVSGPSEEDLLQTVLERLLMPHGEGEPRLASYSGRASLRTWLRVVAKRVRINASRGAQAEHVAILDDLAERLVVPTGTDPELDYLRHRYRQEFTTAFRAALSELDDRSSRLLRMYVTHSATGKEMAATFGVNRVTVIRWLGAVRRSLLVATRAQLERTLSLSHSEFESVIRLLDSSLDVGLSTLLEPTGS